MSFASAMDIPDEPLKRKEERVASGKGLLQKRQKQVVQPKAFHLSLGHLWWKDGLGEQ
jgi:hypothetical protein